MSFQDRRTSLAVFITLLIVFEMLAYVETAPRPQERFFQLYVLGRNRMAADYYPNNDPNIRIRDVVRWYVGVTNLMGNVQFLVIRVKLGNQTIRPPDELRASPSPAPLVAEFTRFVQNNETWEFPFFWRIANAVVVDGSTQIFELEINNRVFQMEGSSAQDGRNFRLIIELWTWDVESGTFQFGWRAGGEHRVAWLQVWFNTATLD